MHLDSPASNPSHNQSSVKISIGLTAQAVQTCEVEESISENEVWEFVLVMTLLVESYTKERIIICAGQLVEANYFLCDMEQENRHQLLRAYLSCGYNYCKRLMYLRGKHTAI